MGLEYVINLPPVTKKNSQRIVLIGGKPRILPSKKYMEYRKEALKVLSPIVKPIEHPVEVKCLFYMPTRRRVDLTNLLEAIDDILVDAQILADDNSNIIVSHDGSRVLYDKFNPRTEVEITKVVVD